MVMCMVKVVINTRSNKKRTSKKQPLETAAAFLFLEVRARQVYVTRNFHSIKRGRFILPALCESSSKSP